MFRPQRISFSKLLVPLAVALVFVLGICGALYLREADQIEGTTLDNENRRMERFTGLFRSDVTSMVSDLRLLASGDALQNYLAGGNPADLVGAAHRAVFFSKDNPDYDQIRYIDEQGQELLRVNQNGAIVPQDELQNKADRPYFQKANALAAGQIYISAIDLNEENGVIEKPIKPMLRAAIPVFGPNGQRRGVYIINFLVANSIERLREFVPRYHQRFRLLNAHGYWLAGAKPEQEWGFILPDRSEMTMAKTDPALWAKVVRDPEGQEPSGRRLFYVASCADARPGRRQARDPGN